MDTITPNTYPMRPDPYTMPKNVHCLSFINRGDKLMLDECRHLDLGSGCVGYSTNVAGPDNTKRVNYVRRALALIFAKYPVARGKVAIYRCPFAFAPFETFELVATDAPEYANQAQEVAKHDWWHITDSYLRGEGRYADKN